MKIARFVLLGCMVLFTRPLVSQTTVPAPDVALPSTQLRQLMDSTLPNLNNIASEKPPPIDRTTLTTMQVDFAAKAQTAPPAQQPMYRAALKVINNIAGALNEYERAVTNYHYSQNLHGKSDREDAKVSNSQRGWDAGTSGRTNNAKQKQESDAERQTLLDKEKNMSNAAIGAWTRRLGQIQVIVEQSYTAELIAEKQWAVTSPATPPPIPVPKLVPRPVETNTAIQLSPAGTWNGPKGTWTLTDDGTIKAPDGAGSWQWTDRTNRELLLHWQNDTYSQGIFSQNGKTLELKPVNGETAILTR